MPEIGLHEADPCLVAEEWGVDPRTTIRLRTAAVLFTQATGRTLTVISGYRTCADQQSLAEQGRPAAPCDVSTHTSCPATGVDLRITPAPVNEALRRAFGGAVEAAGLRWGGGSPRGEGGIPSDWNHVDLGPRQGP